MAKCFIVWNEDRSEGVIFSDVKEQPAFCASAKEEAEFAQSAEPKTGVAYSTLAHEFVDCYEGHGLIQELDIDIG